MPFDSSAFVIVVLLIAVVSSLVAYLIRICTAETHPADMAAKRAVVAKSAVDSRSENSRKPLQIETYVTGSVDGKPNGADRYGNA